MAVVLVAFVALGTTYALTTPLFEAGDELWHYPLVRHLAQGGEFPIQSRETVGPWKQQASQPPLYYYLMGWATAWIDTSDFVSLYQLNPHVDNGIVTPDGNINLAVHTPAEQAWTGTALAVKLIRLLGVLMGSGTVLCTYLLARELRPQWPWLAVAAAALVAFNPMFLFISGAVNNDNLANLLAAAAMYGTARLAHRDNPDWTRFSLRFPKYSWRWEWGPVRGHIRLTHVLLGVLVGLAGQTKLSAMTIAPMVVVVMTYNEFARWWQQPRRTRPGIVWRHVAVLAVQGAVTFGIAGVIAGPWFIRNLTLYGSLTGLNAFIDVLGARAQPAPLAQLWSERAGFMQSYWGLFGGVNVPYPDWVYAVLNTLAVAAVIGLVIFLFRKWLDEKWDMRRWLPTLVTLGFVATVIVSLINWATTTWSSQGRLVFAAQSAIATLMTYGLVSWIPRQYAPARHALMAAVGLFMFGLAAYAPWGIIAPAYADPPEADLETMAVRLDLDFGAGNEPDEMRLLGYTLETATVRPGEAVRLTLYWQALTPMNRNWSVFVHVLSEDGIVVAQRDTYPGLGLLATRKMAVGQTVADSYWVTLPVTAYAPSKAVIQVGLYDLTDGFRLPVRDGENAVTLAQVTIAANAGAYPNPQAINFQNRLRLVGYDLDSRVVAAGEDVTMTLYWQAVRQMTTDYSVSAQVRGAGESRWGQLDSWPGDRPTSGLNVGEVVEDVRAITVLPETPPGTYDLQVVVYSLVSEAFERLQVINADGRWLDNFVFVGKIRVE